MSSRRARQHKPSESDATQKAKTDTAHTSQGEARNWERLDAAVTPTGTTDLLSSIPTETGSIRAIAPEMIKTPGGQWVYDEIEEDYTEPQAHENKPQEQNVPPAETIISAQETPEDWSRLAAAQSPQKTEQNAVLRVAGRVLTGLAVPAALLMIAVRVVASPLFLWAEYHRPGFPQDSYGFTTDQRMSLGSHGVDYILNWAPESFLGDVRASNGLAFFQQEEIAHMTDVKHLMHIGLWMATVIVILAAAVVVMQRRQDAAGLVRAANWGAVATIVTMVVLSMAALVSWEWFFTAFHSVFFAAGSWTFNQSDTLIRLYPTQFWIDAALSVAIITLVGCLGVMLWGRRKLRSLRNGS